jgi:hypothetical protein
VLSPEALLSDLPHSCALLCSACVFTLLPCCYLKESKSVPHPRRQPISLLPDPAPAPPSVFVDGALSLPEPVIVTHYFYRSTSRNAPLNIPLSLSFPLTPSLARTAESPLGGALLSLIGGVYLDRARAEANSLVGVGLAVKHSGERRRTMRGGQEESRRRRGRRAVGGCWRHVEDANVSGLPIPAANRGF